MRARSTIIRGVYACSNVGGIAAVAALMVTLAACGSAKDLAGQGIDDEPTDSPTTSQTPTSPPTTSPTTPTPSSPPTPTVARPKVGECRTLSSLDVTARVSNLTVTPRPCGDSHNAQTYKVANMSGAVKSKIASSDTIGIYKAALSTCEGSLPGWLGANITRQKQSQFNFVVGVPSSTDVAAGANWVRCDVTLRQGIRALELPASSKGLLRGKRGNSYLTCYGATNPDTRNSKPCREPHNLRSVSAEKIGSASKRFPGTSRVAAFMKPRCRDAGRDYFGSRRSFSYTSTTPTSIRWAYGDRWGVCFVKTKE